MAYDYLTMLDIAKKNGSDPAVGLIEEALVLAPELGIIPANVRQGTTFKSLHRTANPSGGFRNVNEGVEPKKSTYENKLHEMKYLDHQMEMDVAVAQASEDGEASALSMEAQGHANAATQEVGRQIFYGTGTGGDAKGFPGAVQIVDSSLVVDAGGATEDVNSSVYFMQLGNQQARIEFGMNKVFNVAEWRKQTITRSSKEMTAWKNSLEGWVGMSFINKYAVARIKKLTLLVGLTDTFLYSALQKLQEKGQNITPENTVIVMSPRSQNQLRLSRVTALLIAPPLPKDWNGIPIIATNSILNTEKTAL